jgi:hypothetical protein
MLRKSPYVYCELCHKDIIAGFIPRHTKGKEHQKNLNKEIFISDL